MAEITQTGTREITVGSSGKLTVSSGGVINVESGGFLKLQDVALTPSATEINYLHGMAAGWVAKLPGAPTIAAPGTQAGNDINIAIQLNDSTGTALAVKQVVYIYISDDSGGDGLTATAPSGGFAIGTDGKVIEELTADSSAMVLSESDGDIDLTLTEASTGTWYLVVVWIGGIVVSDAITFA